MAEFIIDMPDDYPTNELDLYYPDERDDPMPIGEAVVRCRDCEHFEQDYTDGVMFGETVCWAWDNGHDYPSFTNPNGFCHRGKRRESE